MRACGGDYRFSADAIGKQGSEAKVKSLKNTAAKDVERSDAIAIGSWVEGFVLFRVGPAKGVLDEVGWLPPLAGKPTAVFCTYGFNPRSTLKPLRHSLEAKGAKVVAENASYRAHRPGRHRAGGTAVRGRQRALMHSTPLEHHEGH